MQSHLRARLNYLCKAATYLQQAATASPPPSPRSEENIQNSQHHGPGEKDTASLITRSIPRQYIAHMRGVSRKCQLRLPVHVKRSFCKRCDLHLIPNITCEVKMENASRGARKPWANVLTVRCNACGTEKRFPQTSKRGEKLPSRRERKKQKKAGTGSTTANEGS